MKAKNHSLGDLLVHLYPRLLARVRYRLGGRGDAEDVIQDLYLRLQGVSHETVVLKPEAYIFRAADHLVIERFRKAQFANQDLEDNLADGSPSVEREIDGRKRLAALRAAVEALPPRQREAFVMAKFHGVGQAEIAERMGISRSAVEKLLVKALAHCRAALEELT
ncbi:RNA polymerase sigma factor [Brucellaceae bacterium D45D]